MINLTANRIILKGALFFALMTGQAVADIVYLKSGRSLKANKIWRENGKVVCSIDGNTISFNEEDVSRIEKNERNDEEKKEGFQFDIWQSAMTIEEILFTARRHDIPLLKWGLISANKKFNPETSTKYAKTATHYYYSTNLLGRPAQMDLFLTTTSKKLRRLSITWNLEGNPKKDDFEREVADTITGKYGPPKKQQLQIFGRSTLWQPTPRIEIEFKLLGGAFILAYQDAVMEELHKTEEQVIEKRNKAEYQRRDSEKF